MSEPAQTLPYRFEDFLDWERQQSTKHEFLDGVVRAMTGTSDRHNEICLNFAIALRQHLDGGPCRVYMADVMLRVETADAAFYPDLMVTCSEADQADRYVKREPTLLVEVLSPSTATYDMGAKFAAYRQLPSLREYVLVDPDAPYVEVFRPGPEGKWIMDPAGPKDTMCLESVGLELPIAVLYRD